MNRCFALIFRCSAYFKRFRLEYCSVPIEEADSVIRNGYGIILRNIVSVCSNRNDFRFPAFESIGVIIILLMYGRFSSIDRHYTLFQTVSLKNISIPVKESDSEMRNHGIIVYGCIVRIFGYNGWPRRPCSKGIGIILIVRTRRCFSFIFRVGTFSKSF